MGNTNSFEDIRLSKRPSYSTLNLSKRISFNSYKNRFNTDNKSFCKRKRSASVSSLVKLNSTDKTLKSSLIVQKGYSIVELSRANNSQFGLTIAGGTDKDSRPRICDLKPGSIAHRSDELQVGDMIISINGVKTQGLKHEEIIDLIKNANDTLCLEFEYNLPPWPIHPHHAVRSQTVHIQLEKENNSYGFTLRGGYNEDKQKSRPLIVTNIRAGGPADRESTLKIGDRILAINGINVLNANIQEAYCILKQCKGLTLFLVEYDSAIVDSIKNSNGPLLIEIEKSPGSSIGIKLAINKSPINSKNQILVESVKPASIADRCGAIYVGDQILSIDDISFEHVTLAEANQILKNCVGEFSRVEILPLSQMHSNRNQKNLMIDNSISNSSSSKSNCSTLTQTSSSGASIVTNSAFLNSSNSGSNEFQNQTNNNNNNNSKLNSTTLSNGTLINNGINANNNTNGSLHSIHDSNFITNANNNNNSNTLTLHQHFQQKKIKSNAKSSAKPSLNNISCFNVVQNSQNPFRKSPRIRQNSISKK